LAPFGRSMRRVCWENTLLPASYTLACFRQALGRFTGQSASTDMGDGPDDDNTWSFLDKSAESVELTAAANEDLEGLLDADPGGDTIAWRELLEGLLSDRIPRVCEFDRNLRSALSN
jgi:hypothetical protein